LGAGRVRARRNYTRQNFGTPKSRRSSRSVPLADRVGAELERHFRASEYQGDEDLVFAHPLRRAGVGKFERVRGEGEEVERRPLTRFHDLRHTFGRSG
jgi:integrase